MNAQRERLQKPGDEKYYDERNIHRYWSKTQRWNKATSKAHHGIGNCVDTFSEYQNQTTGSPGLREDPDVIQDDTRKERDDENI